MAIEQFKTDEVILSNINQDTIPRQVVMQGEKDGRSLTVQVRNGGIVEPQAGLNLNLGWKHRTAKDKNGTLIQGLDAFQAIDRENGIFRIEYASSMAQPGTIDAEIQFVTSTSVTKSQPFVITVKQSTVDENAVESESSFTVLQEALTKVSQYDDKIEGLQINKADKTDIAKVEDLVSKMPSATPKETFNDLDALKAKYPNGNESAMLVLEADGKTGYVYLWSGSEWEKGALYQAQGIPDKGVTNLKLANTLDSVLADNKAYRMDDRVEVFTERQLIGYSATNGFASSANPEMAVVKVRIEEEDANKVLVYTTINKTGATQYMVMADRSNVGFSNTPISAVGDIDPSEEFVFTYHMYISRTLTYFHIGDCLTSINQELGYLYLSFRMSQIDDLFIGFENRADLNRQILLDNRPEKQNIDDQMTKLYRRKMTGYNSSTQAPSLQTNNQYFTVLFELAELGGKLKLPLLEYETSIQWICFQDASKRMASLLNQNYIPRMDAEYTKHKAITDVDFEEGTFVLNIGALNINQRAQIKYIYVTFNRNAGYKFKYEYMPNENKYWITVPASVYSVVDEEVWLNTDSAVVGFDSPELAKAAVKTIWGNTFDTMTKSIQGTSTGNQAYTVYENNNVALGQFIYLSPVLKHAGEGQTKKVMVIGESTSAGGTYLGDLKTKFENDGANIEFVGSYTQSGTGIKLEAIGGDMLYKCVHSAKRGPTDNYDNRFYNPDTQLFDYAYYKQNQGVEDPDIVVLNFGINDTSGRGYRPDYEDSYIADLNHIMSSVKSVNPNAKFVIGMTHLPARNLSTSADNTDLRRMIGSLLTRLIREYDMKVAEGVILSPMHLCVHQIYDFPTTERFLDEENYPGVKELRVTDAIHTNAKGDKKRAAVTYSAIKKLME